MTSVMMSGTTADCETRPTLATRPASLQIGPLVVDPPVLQAPMAWFTNYAFRQIVREYVSNAGLVGAVLCAAGGGSFGLLAGLASHDTEEAGFLGLVLGGAAGGVLGYFLFRSPGNDEVLYASSQSTQTPFTFTLSPVVSKDRKGALFTVTW